MNRKRIFGYDAYPLYKSWHVHPLRNPENHISSKELTIEQIARLYSEVLNELRKG